MERSNDLCRKILDHGPSPSTLLFILERMKKEGRVNEAVRECIKALRQYPDDIRLRWLLSECYLDLGFFSLAEKEIALAAKDIEKLVPIFEFQAELFERQRRYGDAYAALQKYVAHVSGDTEVIERLERLKEKKEVPPSQGPTSDEIVPGIATHTLAEIYESQGQLQAAIQTYKQLIAQDPEDLRAKEHLQQLEARTDMGEEILEHPTERHVGREKMIGVLEGWLARIQEINSAR